MKTMLTKRCNETKHEKTNNFLTTTLGFNVSNLKVMRILDMNMSLISQKLFIQFTHSKNFN